MHLLPRGAWLRGHRLLLLLLLAGDNPTSPRRHESEESEGKDEKVKLVRRNGRSYTVYLDPYVKLKPLTLPRFH